MIPIHVTEKINHLVHLLLTRSDHRVSTKERFDLYNTIYTLADFDDKTKQHIVGQIALETARHVLPIYETFISSVDHATYFKQEIRLEGLTVDRARSLIDLAEQYLHSEVDDTAYDELLYEAPFVVANVASFIPDNSGFALRAALIALSEVRYRPFQHTDSMISHKFDNSGEVIKRTFFDWTDVELAESGIGMSDVAIVSAFATASKAIDRQEQYVFIRNRLPSQVRLAKEAGEVPNSESIEVDQDKLREFWLWWLRVAIPVGWQKVTAK